MEINWKQENSKVAKNILKINHELKEELVVLRETIEKYSQEELREERAANLQRTGENQKEVKSVNEQLHLEKDILYNLLFKIFEYHLRQNPQYMGTVAQLFQEQIISQMKNQQQQAMMVDEGQNNQEQQQQIAAAQQMAAQLSTQEENQNLPHQQQNEGMMQRRSSISSCDSNLKEEIARYHNVKQLEFDQGLQEALGNLCQNQTQVPNNNIDQPSSVNLISNNAGSGFLFENSANINQTPRNNQFRYPFSILGKRNFPTQKSSFSHLRQNKGLDNSLGFLQGIGSFAELNSNEYQHDSQASLRMRVNNGTDQSGNQFFNQLNTPGATPHVGKSQFYNQTQNLSPFAAQNNMPPVISGYNLYLQKTKSANIKKSSGGVDISIYPNYQEQQQVPNLLPSLSQNSLAQTTTGYTGMIMGGPDSGYFDHNMRPTLSRVGTSSFIGIQSPTLVGTPTQIPSISLNHIVQLQRSGQTVSEELTSYSQGGIQQQFVQPYRIQPPQVTTPIFNQQQQFFPQAVVHQMSEQITLIPNPNIIGGGNQFTQAQRSFYTNPPLVQDPNYLRVANNGRGVQNQGYDTMAGTDVFPLVNSPSRAAVQLGSAQVSRRNTL